jgi:hypothetical protein
MNRDPIGERDRDRALILLRWLTAISGIGSLVVAALGTAAAARASTPSPPTRPSGIGLAAKPAPGSLSPEQLAALDFALPKPTTVVIWATPARSATGARAGTPPPAPGGPQAPAATAAPRPAPTPPPPPVATTGTS